MLNALTYIGSKLEYSFYARFVKPLKSLDVNLVLVTTKPSLYLQGLMRGYDIYIIKYSSNTAINNNIYSSKEINLGQWSIDSGTRLFNSLFEFCDLQSKRGKISNIFIWSDYSIPAIALSEYAKLHNIKKLHFEQSNIPGKIFVDPIGTNYKAMIYNNPEILDKYEIIENEYLNWREEYLVYKKHEFNTPLGKKSKEIQNIFFIIDSIGSWLFGFPKIGEMNIAKKIAELYKKKNNKINYDDYNIKDGEYIFFPMQVATDSQVLFNTEVSLIGAINYALARSIELKLTLLIKPHPVETDQKVYLMLDEYRKRYGCKIVNIPTVNLIKYSKQIITINSTVGLESLIMEKEVIFLGKTIFTQFNKKRLMNYILRYLINVDYFTTKDLTINQINSILARNE